MSKDNQRGHNADKGKQGFQPTGRKAPKVPTPSAIPHGRISPDRLTHAQQEAKNAEDRRLFQIKSDFHELERNASNQLVYINWRFRDEAAGKKIAEACAIEFAGGDNYGLGHNKGYDVFLKTIEVADANLEANIKEWIDSVNAITDSEIAFDPEYWATKVRDTDEQLRASYFRTGYYRDAKEVRNATIRYAEDIYAKANGYTFELRESRDSNK